MQTRVLGHQNSQETEEAQGGREEQRRHQGAAVGEATVAAAAGGLSVSTVPRKLGFSETCPFTGKARYFPRKRQSFPCHPGPTEALLPEEVRSRDFWNCFKEPTGSSRARLPGVVDRGGEEEADPDMRRLLWP